MRGLDDLNLDQVSIADRWLLAQPSAEHGDGIIGDPRRAK
jgi:hypothetical protein